MKTNLYDRRISTKAVEKALKIGSWKAGQIIREINQEVRLNEGKNTRAGWVLASRVAKREDISLEALIQAQIEIDEKRGVKK